MLIETYRSILPVKHNVGYCYDVKIAIRGDGKSPKEENIGVNKQSGIKI